MSRISLVVVNPGGAVRTTELPPGGERPLRVALEARAVVSVQIDGGKLSLAQWTEGRQLSWRKRGRKLLLQVDGQTLAELDDFFASQGQDRADDPAIELFAEDGASELWTASALEAYLGKGSDLVFDGAWPRTSMPWSGADQGLHQPGRELGAEILTQRDWAASATSGSVVSAGLAAQSGTGGVGGVAFVLAGLAAAALTRAGGETQVSSLTFSIQGSIYAGPMASNPGGDMVVRAYDSAGAVVAESVVAADGSYTLLMRLTVRSAGDRAIVLKAFDKNLSNANVPTYWDEATEQIQAVPILLAVIHLTTGTSQCHITPVSTLAAMRAGVNASAPIAPSVEKIDQANDLLGDLLLSGSQILSTTPEPTIKADGRPNLQSNMFGVVLNQLSWIEKNWG